MIQYDLTIKDYEPTNVNTVFIAALKGAVALMLNCSVADISIMLTSSIKTSGQFVIKHHSGGVESYSASYNQELNELKVVIKKKPF